MMAIVNGPASISPVTTDTSNVAETLTIRDSFGESQVHWNEYGFTAVMGWLSGGVQAPGGGATPSQDYHRYLGDKVGQLWPRRSLNVQEVDMGYIFRGVARTATLTDQTQTVLTIDLSAGDSDAFSGSGTTEIVYNGPPMSMLLSGQLKFAVNGTGARRLGLLHNGVEVAFERANPDATSSYTTTLAWPIVVADGDTFGMRAYQNSGGNLDVSEGQLRGMIVGEWQ